MKRKIISLAAIASLLATPTVFAAAFQFYELGTPVIGTAGVGQAAVAYDASTAYFNPAGMSELNASQFMLGSQILLPYTRFSVGSSNTIAGDNGGSAANLTPGGSFYYVYNISPKIKFGASLVTPYAGMLNYSDGWVGRYNVQSTNFFTLDFNPALSYQVNQHVSFGVGATLEYAYLNQTVALPLIPLVDGQANIKATNWAPGYNVGVLFKPYNTTKIGLAYRSRILHNLSGSTTFLRLGVTPTTKTKMTMPQNVILSLDQTISDRFNLLGELGWANWASMRSSVVNIAGFSATTDLDWKDTYRIGLGAQFKLKPDLTLQAGASYDSSPTKSTLRTPNLPADQQYRFSAGVLYSVAKAIKLGFSYEYLNFGRAPINNVSSAGTLQGHYSLNYANVFQASVNVEV